MSAGPGLPSCRIVVLAKAPVPGQVKTRLAATLGAGPAADLARRLLDHALRQALAAAVGPVRLCGSPDPAHPAFGPWAGHPGLEHRAQCGGDLGERMAAALREAAADPLPAGWGQGHAAAGGPAADQLDAAVAACAAGAAGTAEDPSPGNEAPAARPFSGVPPDAVLLIGSDAPALDAHRLRAAAAALGEHPVVFVPAWDGGYAAVGLRTRGPWTRATVDRPGSTLDRSGLLDALFVGVPWSQADTLQCTRMQLSAAGVDWQELEAVHDIDTAEDLARGLPSGV